MKPHHHEYLLSQFASSAGKKAGEFYTPQEVSIILAKIVSNGKTKLKNVYDPTCGSGSLLLRVAKEVKYVSEFYGQELNQTTYNLARMNMIMHGDGHGGVHHNDGLLNVNGIFDGRFDIILTNPPFGSRVEKSLKFLTSGYKTDIHKLVNDALYSENYNEMVIVKDIDVYSLCEHHMLPFVGKCHVAYLPKGKIIGLSKIPRLIDAYSRRLQVQERLTTSIAQCINNIVKPAGVAVVIDAVHLCMAMRGVEKQNSYTTTSSMLGCFKDDARTRSEFLSLLAPSRTSS